MRNLLEDSEPLVGISHKSDVRGPAFSQLSKQLLASWGHLQSQGQHVLVYYSLKPLALRVFSTAQASLELLTVSSNSRELAWVTGVFHHI